MEVKQSKENDDSHARSQNKGDDWRQDREEKNNLPTGGKNKGGNDQRVDGGEEGD